ncbi:MAG: enoyl-CoA hydratase-related protein, partial [Pseudomonadota bacterium]
VPANDLMEEALDAARKIANFSKPSVSLTKAAVNRAFETTLQEGVLFERRVFHSLFATEDQDEGMNAFIEKREPQFKDR